MNLTEEIFTGILKAGPADFFDFLFKISGPLGWIFLFVFIVIALIWLFQS